MIIVKRFVLMSERFINIIYFLVQIDFRHYYTINVCFSSISLMHELKLIRMSCININIIKMLFVQICITKFEMH